MLLASPTLMHGWLQSQKGLKQSDGGPLQLTGAHEVFTDANWDVTGVVGRCFINCRCPVFHLGVQHVTKAAASAW